MDVQIYEAKEVTVHCPACRKQVSLLIAKNPSNQVKPTCPACGVGYKNWMIDFIRKAEFKDEKPI